MQAKLGKSMFVDDIEGNIGLQIDGELTVHQNYNCYYFQS